jgi:hypothetical protein
MSVSSVSPYLLSSLQAAQSSSSEGALRQGLSSLANALQSGNLATAQTAYAALSKSMQNASGPGSRDSSFQQSLGAIGTALQSGSLGQAQQALSALQGQMQTQHGRHRHHRDADPQGAGNNQQSSATAPAATTGDPKTTDAAGDSDSGSDVPSSGIDITV